jgi:hypothetical protein
MTVKAKIKYRDSSVGTTTGHGQYSRGSICSRIRDFSALQTAQTGSGGHPACYAMGTGALWLGIKRPGRETEHLVSSGAEVKHGGSVPPHRA